MQGHRPKVKEQHPIYSSQPPYIGTLMKSDSRSCGCAFASHELQDLRTQQLGEHSENLQALTGVFLEQCFDIGP